MTIHNMDCKTMVFTRVANGKPPVVILKTEINPLDLFGPVAKIGAEPFTVKVGIDPELAIRVIFSRGIGDSVTIKSGEALLITLE